jgi:telomerase protein component 1
MVEKFVDFDVYQLGKYNKERSVKRKQLKKRLQTHSRSAPPPQTSSEKPTLTLKQMIRQLHLSEPIEPIMCLLGKKYPATEAEFRLSGLPGNFDPKKSGK